MSEKDYLARGYSIVPLPAGEKGPKIPDWPKKIHVLYSGQNVGIILGERSGGLVDVDLDCDLAITLAPFILPETHMIHGRASNKYRSHRWYRVQNPPGSVEQFKGASGMVVELRSGSLEHGAQTMVPPSRHPGGEHLDWYEFGEPGTPDIGDLRTAVSRLASAVYFAEHFPATGRHEFCLALAGVLLSGGLSTKEAYSFVLGVATAGGSDEPSARASVVYSTAEKIKAGQNVTGIPRLKSVLKVTDLKDQAFFETCLTRLGLNKPAKKDDDEPYTKDEIEEFAKVCGITYAQYMGSLLVTSSKSPMLWVRDRTGYRSAMMLQAKEKALGQYLAKYPIERFKDDKPIPVARLLDAHTFLVEHAQASFTVKDSTLDIKRCLFIERLAPERPIEPKYNAQIDKWLRLLGGCEAEKLLDWLACVTTLTHQSAALYLCGEQGAGKTLLSSGVTRIWKDGAPLPLDSVMGSFQDGLTQCPLLFADESISNKESSANLRALIGTSALEINRKHLSSLSIDGAIRIIAAGNNDGMLSFNEILGSSDLEAIARRFIKIDVGERPRKYLEELGGYTATESWVAGDGIAAHVQWLVRNRKVVRGKRFIVDGNIEAVLELMKKHGQIEQLVLGLVVEALQEELDPPPILVDAEKYIWLHPARVAQRLKEDKTLKYSIRQICTAAANVCTGDRIKKVFPKDPNKTRTNVKKIELRTLIEWCDQVIGLDIKALSNLVNKKEEQQRLEREDLEKGEGGEK